MSLFDTGADHDPAILLPNRYSDLLRGTEAKCPCGGTGSVREGLLGNHFPPLHNGAALKDPFLPGNSLCRYSGRTVTLEAAVERDNAPTKPERQVSRRLRVNPSAWLGALNWVGLDDISIGDRVGFTQLEQPDPYGARFAVERVGSVTRRGKTFALIVCDEDGLDSEVRLKAKDWERARVRRK